MVSYYEICFSHGQSIDYLILMAENLRFELHFIEGCHEFDSFHDNPFSRIRIPYCGIPYASKTPQLCLDGPQKL